MPQYLLSIYQPDGPPPDAETLARIMADLHRLNEELRESGSWVFTGGLHAPDTATVVRADGMITDGPYVEGKEHIGGLWVITAPDLDAALSWGRKAAAATTLPIEVRPFRDVEPL
ncbi:YciI family protein [Actinacidiphila bryophytorum]|uniref:YciI family protein n=1 Tax=Actinacidiphila bryophytorum TaxID=1436133 RepID=UPI002176E8B7|nr:YciI family protein [Actinacidiphila bryophytorum]UWE11388.1 YciI family protein [Actinacidiphila bryophytorum]